MNKFKIYKMFDSTSSSTYWSFINEEQKDDEFIECVQKKEISKDELTELFDNEDDLSKSVLFESLLELVEIRIKEELKDKINNEIIPKYKRVMGAFDKVMIEEILELLESEDNE